jgi:hypothetical protein
MIIVILFSKYDQEQEVLYYFLFLFLSHLFSTFIFLCDIFLLIFTFNNFILIKGMEAQLFGMDLFRMYQNYAGFKVIILLLFYYFLSHSK